MATRHFPYNYDNRWFVLFLLLGVNKKTDGVTVTDTEVIAKLGRYSLRTPLSNVKGGSISGPHRWYTAVGVRLSLFDPVDDGITFSTNHYRGVTIEFVDKVPKVTGFKPQHSWLYVSPADCEGLVAALKH
ncbi:MAG TPA: hypothetical protein VF491_10330 [Vicinamibacterales bacterium]|jgi:hypothetical protein